MSKLHIALFDHCVLQGRIYSFMPQELLKLLDGHSLINRHSSKGSSEFVRVYLQHSQAFPHFSQTGCICTVKGGKRLPADCELLDTPTKHPYIRVRDVGNSRYVCLTDQFQYIDEETHSAISRYIVNTDDIIISIVGTIGLLGKIHSSLDNANLTENCVKLTNIHTVTSDYLYYTLCYKKQAKEIELLTVGAVQAKLPIYNIQSIKILVPPKEAIEDFQNKLNVLNEQIEANTIEINKLYELQSLFLAKLSD